MSYRRQILREVWDFFAKYPDPGNFLAADSLRCFQNCPINKRSKFLVEIQRILTEGLIRGQRGPIDEKSGQFTIAVQVNPEKIDEYKRAMAPDYKFLIGTVIAVIGLLLALLALMLQK
jgi:hypothetical protein